MKKCLSLVVALLISFGAYMAPASAQSPIFGGAKVTTMSQSEAAKVTGKGNSTAAYYGYLGNYYASYAIYYGSLGNYYNYFSGYSGYSYYYTAYVYSYYATQYYYNAYYYG